MSRIKCKQCDLINFESDVSCKRCGADIHFVKPKRSKTSLPLFHFSGLFRWLIYLAIGLLIYFGYQNFVAQTNSLNQQIQQKNSTKVEVPAHLKGYENSIKSEVKKTATPTPENVVR